MARSRVTYRGAINENLSNVLITEEVITILFSILKQFKKDVADNKHSAGIFLQEYIEKQNNLLTKTNNIGKCIRNIIETISR